MRFSWLVMGWLLAAPVWALTAADIDGCGGNPPQRTLTATPADYRAVLPTLQAGDRLQLAAGMYTQGLPLNGINGAAGQCIVIEGPASGAPAVFTGRSCCNTVSLGNSSYLVIKNLELDGQGLVGVDGVKAEGTADWAHHITLENLYIHGHGGSQQTVGISSKCPAWNWVIRRNVIDRAGTGLYLGNSDGEDEFVNGLIEYNLITDAIGYNAQIKRQNGRNLSLGDGTLPANGRTVIRYNVFSKAANASGGVNARPNLLVGHWPLTGPGAEDDYLIYGNFFYQNATGFEGLFQGTGNLSFYANVLYNSLGPGVVIQAHEGGTPRRVRVFHNTVLAATTGISVTGLEPGATALLRGNALFAATPLSGGSADNNVTDTLAAATTYLVNPSGVVSGAVNRMDLHPLPEALVGTGVDLTPLSAYPDYNRDFAGVLHDGQRRGAYAGMSGWALALERRTVLETLVGLLFEDGFE